MCRLDVSGLTACSVHGRSAVAGRVLQVHRLTKQLIVCFLWRCRLRLTSWISLHGDKKYSCHSAAWNLKKLKNMIKQFVSLFQGLHPPIRILSLPQRHHTRWGYSNTAVPKNFDRVRMKIVRSSNCWSNRKVVLAWVRYKLVSQTNLFGSIQWGKVQR